MRRSVEGQRRGRLGFALAQCGQADQHQDDHRPARTGHGEQAAACADRVDRGSGDSRAERGARGAQVWEGIAGAGTPDMLTR